MKSLIPILLLFCIQPLFAQQKSITEEPLPLEKKHELVVSFGKPFLTSELFSLHNGSFGIGYRFHYFKSFIFEGFYSYSQNNTFPSFFDNEAERHAYILSGKYMDIYHANWEEIYLHSLGIKPHFVLSGNSKRWLVSVYTAGGFYTSSSSLHTIKSATYSPDGQMIDYNAEHIKKRNNGFFYILPGIQIAYLFDRLSLGLDMSLYHIDLSKFKNVPITTYDFPVMPEHYNVSFTIGFKF